MLAPAAEWVEVLRARHVGLVQWRRRRLLRRGVGALARPDDQDRPPATRHEHGGAEQPHGPPSPRLELVRTGWKRGEDGGRLAVRHTAGPRGLDAQRLLEV